MSDSLLVISNWLHRRGIIRVISSTSSSIEGAPVTVRYESWPRVPARTVRFFADRYFRRMYPARARTYCRRDVERGAVTVARRRVWALRYAPSIRTATGGRLRNSLTGEIGLNPHEEADRRRGYPEVGVR